MIYTSVADIYKAIDEPRERLYKRVESLNEEQANARPDANAWSATEIVEHLTIMEERLVRMMRVMLTKAEGVSLKSDRATVEIKPFSLDELVVRSRNEKYIAPEAMRPSGTVRLADLLVRPSPTPCSLSLRMAAVVAWYAVQRCVHGVLAIARAPISNAPSACVSKRTRPTCSGYARNSSSGARSSRT